MGLGALAAAAKHAAVNVDTVVSSGRAGRECRARPMTAGGSILTRGDALGGSIKARGCRPGRLLRTKGDFCFPKP